MSYWDCLFPACWNVEECWKCKIVSVKQRACCAVYLSNQLLVVDGPADPAPLTVSRRGRSMELSLARPLGVHGSQICANLCLKPSTSCLKIS